MSETPREDADEPRLLLQAEFDAYIAKVIGYFRVSKPLVREGQMTVRDFCERLGVITDEGPKPHIRTPSFEDYRTLVRARLPGFPDATFQHALDHAEVAKRYGLSPEFELFLIESIRIFGQPQVIGYPGVEDGLQTGGVEWSAEKLLQYIQEITEAPGETQMSETDRAMRDA